ncbi:MAG TPA: recombination mediator RecR [Spirochaetota bacterium]|nr:recombination mediator RecR [Spirochaetota bacterium]HPJ33849.1 recombination mediator RecR [Spirochaetota bacterium]
MAGPSHYLERVTREFSKLPGIGHKSASRIAFHLLKLGSGEIDALLRSITELKENIRFCDICGGISDSEICSICSDSGRLKDIICVVEGARDILTIEAAGGYNGVYHVLSGLISPLDGVGPDDLNISSLISRCGSSNPTEIIMALSPTIEGDATTLYLASLITPLGINVTRIAHGLPVGSDLEYVDSATIAKSLEGRVKI